MDFLELEKILKDVPRDWEDNPGLYFGFWDPITLALEEFLGPQYKVTAYDPNIQVTCYYEIKDLGLKKHYSFEVPLVVAYTIYKNQNKECWNCGKIQFPGQ